MSPSRQKLLFLLVLSIFTFNGLIRADDGDAQIDKFYIVSTDDPSMGGCTPDQVQWIKSAYTEAMKMVRGAIEDIDFFKDAESKDDVGAQQRYAKIFSMLAQMFGIKTVDENGGPKDPDEHKRLDVVRGESQDTFCASKLTFGMKPFPPIFCCVQRRYANDAVVGRCLECPAK